MSGRTAWAHNVGLTRGGAMHPRISPLIAEPVAPMGASERELTADTFTDATRRDVGSASAGTREARD